LCFFIFFFFQAEDGIRDRTVTGVQTCALPISIVSHVCLSLRLRGLVTLIRCPSGLTPRMYIETNRSLTITVSWPGLPSSRVKGRSEERRVGKECRSRGATEE